MNVTRIDDAFRSLEDFWSPRVVARVNDQYVKVAKAKGSLAWHKHDDEDELFHVIKGRLRIEYEGGKCVDLGPGDLHVVPRNTLHNPIADDECWILLVETVTTKHTGDVVMEKTKSIEEQLRER